MLEDIKEGAAQATGRKCLDKGSLALADFLARQPVWYGTSKTELRLADMTGAHLKALGLNNDISAGDAYADSQRLSRATHQASADWDGIRFVSRQHNRRHTPTRSSSAAA